MNSELFYQIIDKVMFDPFNNRRGIKIKEIGVELFRNESILIDVWLGVQYTESKK